MDALVVSYKMIVFGVKYRLGLINKSWQTELYSVLGNLINRCGHQVIVIGGVRDHVHILYSEGRQGKCIAETLNVIKGESSRWVNENRLSEGRFAWQRGYAVFSYSGSQLDKVKNYIQKQEEHHRRISFREEVEIFYQKWNITYHPNDLPENLVD